MTDSPDGSPWEHPDTRAWLQNVREELFPKIADSVLTVSLAPSGETDAKFAVELGASIMFDKPILLVIAPGQVIPRKLRQVADLIVEVDFKSPDAAERINDAVNEMMRQIVP